MPEQKHIKKRIQTKSTLASKQPITSTRYQQATKQVQELFQQHPDTSVYSRRYQYKFSSFGLDQDKK